VTIEGVTEDSLEEMVDDLVVRGSDDWVMLSEVSWLVTNNALRHGIELQTQARITVGLEVLRRALERGLVSPGSVEKQAPTFIPWNVDPSSAIEQIEQSWRSVGENLQMGDVCWLANTPAGNSLAEIVRPKVNARADWPPSTT
jgi:hypothetical protein